ncbi:hypothetical protein QAD02_004470 [Eretmocerus hayati]|uniref:Uncharacterized protein n=1 Tax=Eretmocerus hayati TaxID=131215 RepID=A0ACC2NPU3_9HYME|nr:hypothetical protein QAD02_004470 [Eretmocerus hayati]
MMMLDLIFISLWLLENVMIKAQNDTLWINIDESVKENMLNSTVLIVKDEALGKEEKCLSNTKKQDLRYSKKRYLMCMGSILTGLRVLTSASCIHKATYIRHNIRAPLAAVIAWSSDSIQVIRIQWYAVHPNHVVDPRKGPDYFKHNVAVAKLACRIRDGKSLKIDLPTHHFGEYCADNKCSVTSVRKIGKLRFEIKEIPPENTDHHELDKRSISDTYPNYHDIKKRSLSETFLSNGTVEMEEKDGRIIIKIPKSEASNDTETTPSPPDHDSDDQVETPVTKPEGCVQTGSPVMVKGSTLQAALLAKSCDDRQPHTDWIFTDLYENSEWIIKMKDHSHDNEVLTSVSTRMDCLCPSQNSESGKCPRNQNPGFDVAARKFSVGGDSDVLSGHPYTQSIYDMYLNKGCKASCSNPCGGN